MPRKPKRDFVDQKGLKDADVATLQQFSPSHEMPCFGVNDSAIN